MRCDPMTGQVITIRLPLRDEAHRLAGVLTNLSDPAPEALSIFEDASEWRIDAYFHNLSREEGLANVRNAADLAGVRPVNAEWSDLPDENWVALSQAALPPVETPRFTIHGSHDRDKVGRRRWAIEIDAGEAFGTAHHATTYGCLHALGQLLSVRTVRSVLDLGTGSGILAIAAARAWPSAKIIASDIDADAVAVASVNTRKNAASRQIVVVRSNGIPRAIRNGYTGRSGYDLILANILAGPLMAMAAQIRSAVNPRGWLVLSGILNHQAAAIQATYVSHGFSVVRHIRIEGWSTLVARRRPVA